MYRAIWSAPFRKKGKTKQNKRETLHHCRFIPPAGLIRMPRSRKEQRDATGLCFCFFFSPPLALVFISGVCSCTLRSARMPRNQTETLFKSRSSHQSAPLTVAQRSARVQPSPGSSGECFIIDTNWSATLVGCAVSAEPMGC